MSFGPKDLDKRPNFVIPDILGLSIGRLTVQVLESNGYRCYFFNWRLSFITRGKNLCFEIDSVIMSLLPKVPQPATQIKTVLPIWNRLYVSVIRY